MRPVFTIILGLLLSIAAAALFIHDAEYIFTGNTIDLNEVLENGEEIPNGKYVTYTCYVPLGNYAETQEYLNGFIPLPFKTQEFAVLTENNMIISAEIGNKNKIQEMEQLTDDFYASDDFYGSMELTGYLGSNNSEMMGYLQEYFEDVDLEAEGISVSWYAIDTTKTRLSSAGLCIGMFLIGGVVIIAGIRKKRM
ncbi:MAG: hypothetical protein IJ642_06710 [Oscillospiraceae bacterium]|nr:hypothetical protein [Oscillospiraceae bacterium]